MGSVEILDTELAERDGVVAVEEMEEVEELALGDVPITDELIWDGEDDVCAAVSLF